MSDCSNKGWRGFGVAALFFILAVVCLSIGLGRGFILDEYKTWMDSLLTPGDLLRDRLASGHFPTYFLLASGWARIAGTREWVLRIPSVMMVAVAVFPLYGLVLRTYGFRTAVVALTLFCSHQLVLWIGQTARPYAGLLLFSILGGWACVAWWQSGRRRFLAILAGSTLGSVSFMPLGALSFLAFGLAALSRVKKERRRVIPLVMAIVVPLLVLAVPALYLGQSQAKFSVAKQHTGFQPLKAIDGIADLAFGDFRLWGPGRVGNLSAALLLLLLFGFLSTRKAKLSDEKDSAWDGEGSAVTESGEGHAISEAFPVRAMMLWWFFLPALSLAAAQAVSGKNLMSQERYYAPCLGAIIVVFARGLTQLWDSHRKLGWVAVAGCVFLMAPTTFTWWRDPGEGPREVARAMIKAQGGAITAVAGHVRWLRYELHGEIPARELFMERGDEGRVDRFVDYFQTAGRRQPVIHYSNSKTLAEDTGDQVVRWANGEPFWLFVYLNERDALDHFYKVPPAGFKLEKKIEFRDARAGYFVPAS